MMMKRALITGGMGFIGTAVALKFSKTRRVTVVDRLDFGVSPQVDELVRSSGVEFVHADLAISKHDIFHRIENGDFDEIVHLAALTHIPLCEAHPDFAYVSNVIPALNILSRLPRQTRLIVFSTSSTYEPENVKHDELKSKRKPIDFYGISKMHVEDLSEYYAAKRDLSILNIRLANAAGYGETNPKIIGTILKQLHDGNGVVELGNLTPKRDFIHIDDIAWVLGTLFERWPAGRGKAEYLNVATGHEPVSIKELFEKIVAAWGKPVSLKVVEERKRAIDRELLYPDPSKLFRLLPDFKPKRLEEWLPDVVKNPGLRISNNIEEYIQKYYAS